MGEASDSRKLPTGRNCESDRARPQTIVQFSIVKAFELQLQIFLCAALKCHIDIFRSKGPPVGLQIKSFL